MGVLDFYDFTGTNGAAWSASHYTTAGSLGAGSLADIQSNAGRLVAQHTTFGYISQQCAVASRSGLGIYIPSLTFANAVNEQYFQVMLRGNGALTGTEPANCLFMQFMVAQSQVEFAKSLATVHTSLDGANTAWTPNTSPWSMRMEFEATNARLKWWQGSEPAAWNRNATGVNDANLATGVVYMAMVSGNSSTARSVTVDNVEVYDPSQRPAQPVVLSGAVHRASRW